jgi:methyl-accepting chemotaxis protein
MHPIKPEWEGQDMAGKVKDGEGTDILKTISDALKASKDGRVFVPTMFARPGQQALVPKLQYVIRVDGWNWMVGSGLYTDDIDALVRKTLLADLVLVLVVMAVVGGVGFTVARSVLRQIGASPAKPSASCRKWRKATWTRRFPTPTPAPCSMGWRTW